jgi:hypothetical protein
VLTQWTAHVERFAEELRRHGLDPIVLRGGMSAKARRIALARLQPPMSRSPLLVVATGPFVGEGFDCPVLDALFLAAPIAFKGVSCSTWDESCVHIRERPLRRYTTITTSIPGCLPRPWPSARRATLASASPTPANRRHGVDQVAQGAWVARPQYCGQGH